MCVVSMIGDEFTRTHMPQWTIPSVTPPEVPPMDLFPLATAQDIKRLTAEIEAIKKLLAAAKIYDKETGQPDCEKVNKLKLIFDLAKLLGIDMSDLNLDKDGK